MRRQRADRVSQRVAVRVGYRDLAADGVVFRRADRVVAGQRVEGLSRYRRIHRHGHVIDRRDIYRDRRRFRDAA
ncbi:hypothetical protein D3C87_1737780 [compost metagenome]